MKKNILYIAASLVLALAFDSCKEESNDGGLISLTAPADNAVVELTNGQDIRFDWNTIAIAPKYRIAISKTADLYDSETVDVDNPPYLMTATEADAIAARLGVPANTRDTLYWTVRSLPMMAAVETQVRALVVVRQGVPTVTLLTPADGATIDANTATFPLAFTWQKDDRIEEYTVLFAADQTFPETSTVREDRSTADSYTLTTAGELDDLLAALGIPVNGSETVYWTVISTGGSLNSATRSFTATRITKALLSPENNTNVQLDHEAATDNALTFEWYNAAGAQAELVFSKSPDMSSSFTVDAGTGNAKAFTHDELQVLIDNPTYGLKKYYKNELYWNVRISGNLIGETANHFYLSGQRKFVDTRSDETITYEVAVIDNEHYKGIWMAENLRTRKYADGTDIASWMIYEPLPQGTPPAGYNYTTAPGWEGGMVTPPDNPRIGYYYRAEWGVLFTGGVSDVLAPAGWITPVKTDWDALYAAAEAAAAAAGSSDPIGVLKDPVAYGSQSFGAWGVNLSPAGSWDREEPPGYTINFGYISYTKQGDSESGNNTYEYQGVGSRGNHWDTGCVRLKYIGDDE